MGRVLLEVREREGIALTGVPPDERLTEKVELDTVQTSVDADATTETRRGFAVSGRVELIS